MRNNATGAVGRRRSAALRALYLTALVVVAGCGGGSGGPTITPAGTVVTAPPATHTPAGSNAEAWRFLNQATFGATEEEARRVAALGYEAWIDEQLRRPASLQLPHLHAVYSTRSPGTNVARLQWDRVDVWFRNAVRGEDQLRQRVAWALSQVFVVSELGALETRPMALASYYDVLALGAFGDFRTLLEDVTLHPAMGVYLSMLGNRKPDAANNVRPDENFARELLQLFTVGLVQLNPDGTMKTDPAGRTLPTYDQRVVEGFAHVFTGWHYAGAARFVDAWPTLEAQVRPMQPYPDQHDTGPKRLLEYPGAIQTSIPARTPAQPAQDLREALDNVYLHPNVGPHVAKLLIQRLVTSNPSPDYVERVARRFADDGRGRRGNLAAVVKAILLDPEARGGAGDATSGKLKEPLLRLTQVWRAYDAKTASGELRYWLPNPPAVFGQGPLQAPSVFNFYSPTYAPPGALATQGLVAPEMQITTEFQTTQVTNYLLSQAFCWTNASMSQCPQIAEDAKPDLVLLDVGREIAVADDARALVDLVAGRLFGDAVPPVLRDEAIRLVERVPAAARAQRVGEAMFLLASSPEFAIQR